MFFSIYRSSLNKLLLVLSLLSLLAACNNDEPQASAAENTTEVTQASDLDEKSEEPKSEATPKYLPAVLVEEDEYAKYYEVYYDFKEEKWNDPEVLDAPRLQFGWRAPEDGGKKSVWSMRLDGSDLRQVVSAELISKAFEGTFHNSYPIERSPNNRYVAIAGTMCHECAKRRIIDLETKEIIELPNGSNVADFQWMPDSKSIVFNAEGLVHFNLETRKGHYINKRFRNDNRWGTWYLLEGGKKIIASIDSVGYVYDFDSGKLLEKIENWYGAPEQGDKVSYDKKYMIVSFLKDYSWTEFEQPTKSLGGAGEALSSDYAFMTYGAPIYKKCSEGVEVRLLDVNKDVVYVLPNPNDYKGGARNITLYNVTSEDLAKYY